MMNIISFSMLRIAVMALVMAWSGLAQAAENNTTIAHINMSRFQYPAAKVLQKRQDAYIAELTMLTADENNKVEKFYLKQKFKRTSKNDSAKTLTLTHMLTPHVLATVTLLYSNPRRALSDDDLFSDNLMMSLTTGVHSINELTQLKNKYSYLKHRFYSSDPRDTLAECRRPAKDKRSGKQLTAEERGQKMQKLMMQGRYTEAQAMATSFTGAHQALQNETTKDRWQDEIQCLKNLDKHSFKVQIKLLIERDDQLG